MAEQVTERTDVDSSSTSINEDKRVKYNSGKNVEQAGNNGIPENLSSLQRPKESEKKKSDEQRNNDETAGTTSEDTVGPTVPGDPITEEDDHTGEIKAPETITRDRQVDGSNHEDKNTEAEGDDHAGEMKVPETSTHDQQVDGPNVEDTNTDAEGGNEKQKEIVANIGSTSQEATEPTFPEDTRISAADDHTGEMKVPETTTHDQQVDGPNVEDTNTEAEGDSVSSTASTNSKAENDNNDNMEHGGDNGKEEQKEIENIGSTSQEATEPTFPEDTRILAGKKGYLIIVIVGLLAILVPYLFHSKTPPRINEVQKIDIFLRQLEKVKTQFPNQRVELWNRSRIHLKKHLQTAQPTEPVSLILTAGVRAETTLHCLAHGLASALSSALNASVLHIDGASKASQDSDTVKLEIDKKLQGAFDGDKPVAVIHRFEELPPGSTLIFYRYCDHENAAFKKTFLIFTVLLGEEETIPAKSRLSDVEEMVDDHLQKKFLSHGHPVSFDRMDLDKYGGLWSRISHLILPVASEEKIERDGCEDT